MELLIYFLGLFLALLPFILFCGLLVVLIRYLWKKGNNAKHDKR